MGIKYKIYRHFADKKKINSIEDKALNNLTLSLNRFGIGEIVFDGNLGRFNSLAKRFDWKKVCGDLKGEGKLYVTPEKKMEEKGQYYFTPEEFLALLDTPDYIAETEIPRIINTIENDFDRFVILGESAYADRISEYLSGNKNIVIKRISLDEVDRSGDSWVIKDDSIGRDVFVIVPDFYEYHKIYNAAGQQLRTFFVRRIYCPFKKSTEYLLDLREFIIPTLRNNNVKVIWAYTPIIDKLKKARKVKKSNQKWERLSRYFPKRYRSLRARKEHNIELMKEAALIVNDNTRGYSTNYCNGQYINYDNGFRRTIGNTPDASRSVHVFGPCFVRGNNYPDDKTITSLLKKELGEGVNVYNYGSTFHTLGLIMREREFAEGDVVVIFGPMNIDSPEKIPCDAELDLTMVYDGVEDIYDHVFDIPEHFDQVVAGRIVSALSDIIKGWEAGTASQFKMVTKFGSFPKRVAPIDCLPDRAFATWLKSLAPYVKKGGRNGAIVMNCNPFTNGHKYLIETAAMQVDNLYIFVVEEDKSEFKFADRIELVKKGTADIPNVTVLPSGNYVISAQTLPGYFNKDNLGTTELNAESDLEYFLSIADFFGITVRFAGEEPIDRFTAQYNQNMKRFLPRYGIDFTEIARKQSGEEVISASKVRKALHEGDLEKVKRFVPETTYDFLCLNLRK
jgi:cytidyltransferase-like protein